MSLHDTDMSWEMRQERFCHRVNTKESTYTNPDCAAPPSPGHVAKPAPTVPLSQLPTADQCTTAHHMTVVRNPALCISLLNVKQPFENNIINIPIWHVEILKL